jgi:hypothetical protein
MIRWPGRTGPAGPLGPASSGGTGGLIAIVASVACTLAVAAAGPSVMEPVLPGPGGEPPWSLGLHPSGYLVVALTAAGLAFGVLGLVLVLRATRRGWSVPAGAVLAGGLLAAAALTLLPPFGSSDHLSYAAYGRMLVTGHNPYTTTPAQLAALGDPVARAVQDWSGSPSVYGPLATAVQALASLAGGTSVRLTVFVLGLANLVAFAGTALLLHRMLRGRPGRQLRAALLWAANPLLLQVLVAGAHVDSQAVVFAVAAVIVMSGSVSPEGQSPVTPRRAAARCALAGALVGLGFAVKVTIALAGLGLALALVLPVASQAAGKAERWRAAWPRLAALGVGFAVTAGAAVAIGGSAMLQQSSRASGMVSIGSPWRVIRTLIQSGVHGMAATDIVKYGAVLLAVVLAVLLIRGLPALLTPDSSQIGEDARSGEIYGPYSDPDLPRKPVRGGVRPGWGGYAAGITFALALAWLFAWPYVLPWYDALGWALLPLVPLAAVPAADALVWLLIARTAALGFGYLPARATDVTMPAGLAWLQPVLRHGVTPAVLAAATVLLVVLMLRAGRQGHEGSPDDAEAGAAGAQTTATKAA